MTAAAWALLVVAAALAVVDWIGVARGSRALEYVGKPGALAALVLVALTLDPADGSARTWFVVALVLSLAGDVFLMLPRDRFVEGLASFLLAHVAYVVGFTRDGAAVTTILLVAIPVVVVAGLLGARFLRAATRDGDRSLVGPLVAYMAVIAAMVSCALASGNGLAIAGALLFMGSDSLIAETRFVGPRSWGPLGIMVSYHLGQALLTVSLVRGWS